MDKKEKNETVNIEDKKEKCCDKNCNCGCQEGKECSCCCVCGCRKKAIVKFVCALIIFLAGMGFHALLQCGMRCPAKGARPMPIQTAPLPPMPIPSYSDAQGGNIIIINTDGTAGVDRFLGKPNDKGCGCNKMKHDFEKHHLDKMNPNKMRPEPMDKMPNPIPAPVVNMAPMPNSAAVK